MSISELAARLPNGVAVRRRSVALATLDAIMSVNWSSRWYSFDAKWGEHEQLGSMRNGSGDEYSIVFFPDGVFIRGFDHESDMSPVKRGGSLWPGLVHNLPEAFMEFVNEPAFSDGQGTPLITVCLWRGRADEVWQYGDVAYPGNDGDADGSNWLFSLLLESPQGYVDFARDYYEVQIELSDVAAILGGDPLTREQANRMNPGRDWDELVEELDQIQYPVHQ